MDPQRGGSRQNRGAEYLIRAQGGSRPHNRRADPNDGYFTRSREPGQSRNLTEATLSLPVKASYTVCKQPYRSGRKVCWARLDARIWPAGVLHPVHTRPQR
jgi:hypothetical protein